VAERSRRRRERSARRWLGAPTERVFAALAAWRDRRALHPKGVTRAGRARLTASGRSLADRVTVAAVVRSSRGAGLPAGLPDVNGVAIRLVDADGPGRHRDLLFSTASRSRPWLPRPAMAYGGPCFSSILPFDFEDRRVVLTAEVSPGGLRFGDVARAPDVEIAVFARDRRGATRLVDVEVGAPIDGTPIRFDPGGGGAPLVPRGALNALRVPAYRGSQVASGRGRPGAR
jgi:hypothetical protein